YKKSDGKGLYLQITPEGSRLWRMSYRFAGKQKLLSFGAYPTVSLKDARDKRDKARKLLEQKIDPSVAKRQADIA
ncbi:Arm DNA-binding domain-containing protein, partial [Acinetobacter baumannii]|uniref:Arm DNA-binding domain-containing protein n=1 Tax=Acinetobacter baumannii TaxID=470 RepID=UPI0013D4A679